MGKEKHLNQLGYVLIITEKVYTIHVFTCDQLYYKY